MPSSSSTPRALSLSPKDPTNYHRFKSENPASTLQENPPSGLTSLSSQPYESQTSNRRRRITYIISFSIAIFLLIAAATIGTVTVIKSIHSKSSCDPDYGNSNSNNIHPTKAIKQVCDTTLYPNLCVNSFVEFPGAMNANKDELVHMSVNMTLNKFWRALDNVTTLQFGNLIGSSDSFDSSAFQDCVELLQDSVDLLTQSLFSVPPTASGFGNQGTSPTGTGSTEDVRTWLSAALANQDTCTEGLEQSTESLRNKLSDKLDDLAKLVSNCLALFSQGSGEFSGAPIDNGRKLLSSLAGEDYATTALSNQPDEFELPRWMSREDRELLGAAPPVAPGSGSGSTGGGTGGGGIGVQADVIVAQDGSGTVKTISEAIKKAPEHGNQRFIIFIKAGKYEEDNLKVSRKKTNLWFIGEGNDKTLIIGNKSVTKDKITTFRTATFAAQGSGFVAKGITFQNDAGPSNDQAVALRVGADKAAIYQCQIIGYQDTLYAHSNRQFYRECDIYGTVDFIFGNAAAVFQSCNMYSRKPLPMQKITVTAQKRKDPGDISGFSIHKCWIKASTDLEPVKANCPTYLGRPWKPLSRVVVMLTYIGDHVAPQGWLEWNATSPVNLLYYGEYKNYGPRADVSQRVKWPGLHVNMPMVDASKYTVRQFIFGSTWLTYTGVAFQAGLTN